MGYVIQFEIKPEYHDKWISVLLRKLETSEKQLIVEKHSSGNEFSELIIKCKFGSISILCWNSEGKCNITLTPLETNNRNELLKFIDLIEEVFAPMMVMQ